MMRIPLSVEMGKADYAPYEPITVGIRVDGAEKGQAVALSIRDAQTDEPTYADGNMLTDLLLSSDLKGFVASPAWYFEKDDAGHRQALDLLLMVQGWRRYGRVPEKPRYQPEKGLCYEGTVYPLQDMHILELEDVPYLANTNSVMTKMMAESYRAKLEAEKSLTLGEVLLGEAVLEEEREEADPEQFRSETDSFVASQEWQESDMPASEETDAVMKHAEQDQELGTNHGRIGHEVLVECELTDVNGQSVGAVVQTHDRGDFSFSLPPYYGVAFLSVKAYERKDSIRHSMGSRVDDGLLDEKAYPDFYVKQSCFYPAMSRKYNFYQTHQPETILLPQELEEYQSRLEGDHVLDDVEVKGKLRGRWATDFSKPAYVADAYDLYNELTDRGLSWGVFDVRRFATAACLGVYGNMGRYRSLHVRSLLDDYVYQTNYTAMTEQVLNRSHRELYNDLQLKRLQDVRFYTDLEPRNADVRLNERQNYDDVTVLLQTLPDGGKRYSWRDRHYVHPGFARPLACYSPDYSKVRPAAPTDYRRTLYWNPYARLDAHGEFHVTVYNNSRATRVKVNAEGLTGDGRIIVMEEKNTPMK